METARLVENIGVGAYLGAAHIVEDQSFLTAAASIATIEARHQTILNLFNGALSAPQPFDIPLAPPEVLAMVGPFISGCSLGVTGAGPFSALSSTELFAKSTPFTFSPYQLTPLSPSPVPTSPSAPRYSSARLPSTEAPL